MDTKISYDEIQNTIPKFNSIRDEFLAGIQSAIEAINLYKSTGVVIDAGNYDSELSNIVKKLTNVQNQIEGDCNRITTYLNNISNQAKLAVDQSVSAMDAISTFQATETVTKG